MAQLEQDFSKIPTSYLDDYVRDTNSIRAVNPVKNYTKNIDWEQRRYEIAKDAMCAVIQRQSTRDAAVSNNISFEKYSAMTAIYCASALIEELKKRDMITQMDDKYKSPYGDHEWQ